VDCRGYAVSAVDWTSDCEQIVDSDGQPIALLRYDGDGWVAYAPVSDGDDVAWAYHGFYTSREVALAWLQVAA
jgi:hypothetical protein